MLWLALLASQSALASPVHEATLRLSLVHAANREQPWGSQLGVAWLLAFGDRCEPSPSECEWPRGLAGSTYPVAGPNLALEWRGDRHLAWMVGGLGGVAAIDRGDVGFFPYWETEGSLAWRWETDTGVHQLAIGGVVAKNLSPDFYVPQGSYQKRGPYPLSIRIEGMQTWSIGERWSGLLLGCGLQTATYWGQDE